MCRRSTASLAAPLGPVAARCWTSTSSRAAPGSRQRPASREAPALFGPISMTAVAARPARTRPRCTARSVPLRRRSPVAGAETRFRASLFCAGHGGSADVPRPHREFAASLGESERRRRSLRRSTRSRATAWRAIVTCASRAMPTNRRPHTDDGACPRPRLDVGGRPARRPHPDGRRADGGQCGQHRRRRPDLRAEQGPGVDGTCMAPAVAGAGGQGTNAAALACLGSAEGHARVLRALTGPDASRRADRRGLPGTDRSATSPSSASSPPASRG